MRRLLRGCDAPPKKVSIGVVRSSVMRASYWVKVVRTYWAECRRARDFWQLIRLRLSQKRPGHQVSIDVDLRTLGTGVRLRSHSTDISVLSELLVGQSLAMLPSISQVETVVDLGANAGLAYRWLRTRYPGARFVCVEPDPGNVAVLRANADDCQIVSACIGARERTVALATNSGEWGYRMRDEPNGSIPVITMQRLCEEAAIERIDVLKCDIEGAEAELFANCSGWIRRVQSMVVECHLDVLSTGDLVAMLSRNGADLQLVHMRASATAEVATFERRLAGSAAVVPGR